MMQLNSVKSVAGRCLSHLPATNPPNCQRQSGGLVLIVAQAATSAIAGWPLSFGAVQPLDLLGRGRARGRTSVWGGLATFEIGG